MAVEPLDDEVASAILDEVLEWDRSYPVHYSEALAEHLQDPNAWQAFLITHALVWGPSPELAKAVPPAPRLEGVPPSRTTSLS